MSCIFNIYHISHTYFVLFFSVTYGPLKLMPQNQAFREVLFVPRLLNDCSGFRNLWRNISRQKSRRRAAPRLMTWFLSGASRLGHRFRTHHIYKKCFWQKWFNVWHTCVPFSFWFGSSQSEAFCPLTTIQKTPQNYFFKTQNSPFLPLCLFPRRDFLCLVSISVTST